MHLDLVFSLCFVQILRLLEAATTPFPKEYIQHQKLMKKNNTCSTFKCRHVEEPVCVKLLAHKKNAKHEIYVKMINKCEVDFLKCYKDIKANVVTMDYCDEHSRRRSIDINIAEKVESERRIKRELIEETVDEEELDEPTPEEPTTGETTSEEPTTGETTSKEPTTGETTSEEPTTGETTSEEPTTGETTSEGSSPGSTKPARTSFWCAECESDLRIARLTNFFEISYPKSAKNKKKHKLFKKSRKNEPYNGEILRSVSDSAHQKHIENYNLIQAPGILSDLVDLVNPAYCSKKCPISTVMVCARCRHGDYRTFLSTCHLSSMNCRNPDLNHHYNLVARYPCALMTPSLVHESVKNVPLTKTVDDDVVFKHIVCKSRGYLNLNTHQDNIADDMFCNDYMNGYQTNETSEIHAKLKIQTIIKVKQIYREGSVKMKQFLEFTVNKLRTKDFANLTLVLGNESCDLDSAVSSLVYATFLYWQYNQLKCKLCTKKYRNEITYKDDIFVPILNVLREDYELKTEVVFGLKEVGIDSDLLVFKDDFDVKALVREHQPTVILVDHNVLAKDDEYIVDYVKDIIDHRPYDKTAWKYKDDTRSTIELVGSCCTLVCERIKELASHTVGFEEFFKSYPVCADLLHSTIILDTVNFSKEVNKARPLDREIITILENVLNIDNPVQIRESKLNKFVRARADVSTLTAGQLLRKDLKIIGKIMIPSLPLTVQEFLQRPNVESAMAEVLERTGCSIIVMLGMKLDGASVLRDLAIFTTSKEEGTRLATLLEGWSHPRLELTQKDVNVNNCRYYEQNNVSASRKQVIPIINEFLNLNT